MVDFKNRSQLQAWAGAHAPEAAVVLAARMALRVLPVVQTAKHASFMGVLALPAFRAALCSWAAAKYSAHRMDFAAAAAAAYAAAVTAAARVAAARVGAAYVGARTYATSYAAALADEASYAAAYADARIHALNIADAYAADSTRAAPSAGDAAAAFFWSALSTDATLLEKGAAASIIARSPLWPQSQPDQLQSLWQEMKAELLSAKQDWQVWTIWYDDRLVGRVRDETRELGYARIGEALWNQAPAIVNAEIKRRIDERAWRALAG